MGKTLLYAEDDRETRENYTYVLGALFERVYTAADGNEALRLYKEHSPDVLLLDISMPHLDGLDTAAMIRRHDYRTPIVMLTAHSERERLMQAVNLKLDAYLLKPVDDNQLMNTMTQIIAQLNSGRILLAFKNLAWDKAYQQLLYNDHPVKLTKKELLLMKLLGDNAGRYVTRDTIILYVWHDEIPDDSHDKKLTQLIYRLNKKIAGVLDSDFILIENSYAYGYRIHLSSDASR